MDSFERKQAGLPFVDDEKCKKIMRKTRAKLHEYNNGDCWSEEGLKRSDALIREILGSAGKNLTILPPFHCDYGFNITIGDNFFSNYNLVILDGASVTIGNNVFIAPNVGIYTAGHTVHYKTRSAGYEYAIPITIGDDVWIGGNVAICPGVHIGSRCVIGAGSVVTKDIPDDVIAAGNPCRVIREITDDDMRFYFKNREFPLEMMEEINNLE